MKIKGLVCRRGVYYYRPPQIDGRRPPRVSLNTRDLGEAIKLALAMKERNDAAFSRGRLVGEIERFLEAKEKGAEVRPRTLTTMKSTLGCFQRWAGNPIVGSITSAQIDEWKAHMVAEGMSRTGMVAYLRRVQSFFSWQVRTGRIPSTPFTNVKVPSVRGVKSVTFCTREERDRLLSACDREDLRFVLMAGFFLGLRRNEILEARPSWFRTLGLVEVSETPTFRPKDATRRIVHYGARFAEFLASYEMMEPFALRPDVKHGRATYRWDWRRPWEELTARCDLAWVTAHTMRHTFATLHVQSGTPLATVADWLGDSYDVTHRHYAGLCPSNAHRNALD